LIDILSPHQNASLAVDHEIEDPRVQRGTALCSRSDSPDISSSTQGCGI